MKDLPVYIGIIFSATTVLCMLIFFRAAGYAKMPVLIVSAWCIAQAFISRSGFYTNTSKVPPAFLLAILPPIVLITALFIAPAGRRFIQSLDSKVLTLLHLVRIPVELVLFWLFLQKMIPRVMTFEGHNYDILSGLTVPIVYYFVFVKNPTGKKYLLLWNVACLALLLNIFIIAILSAPFKFQQLGFEQPNTAILYFPFVWLPACIVPLVLFAHLAAISQLMGSKKPAATDAKL